MLPLRNLLDYPLRQFFRWRRGGLHFRNESKEHLFAHLRGAERAAAEAEAERLLAAYRLQDFRAHSQAVNYRENLFYLELLERGLAAAGAELPDPLAAADIGVSHWFYVQALYAGLREWRAPHGRTVRLEGYESDPWRVYVDLRSRHDHALAHLRGLEAAQYRPRGFARQAEAFDVVTLFFPFVFLRDHREWGLPDRLFDPRVLLADAWASLKPGGVLLVVNQGEAEHSAQRKMFAELGIPERAAYRHATVLFEYDLPRYVLAAVQSA